MVRDAAVEFARNTADSHFVPDVSRAEPAGRQTANVSIEFKNHSALGHSRGLDGRGDPTRSAAVNTDVNFHDFCTV
jgi:hypothetical protein